MLRIILVGADLASLGQNRAKKRISCHYFVNTWKQPFLVYKTPSGTFYHVSVPTHMHGNLKNWKIPATDFFLIEIIIINNNMDVTILCVGTLARAVIEKSH